MLFSTHYDLPSASRLRWTILHCAVGSIRVAPINDAVYSAIDVAAPTNAAAAAKRAAKARNTLLSHRAADRQSILHLLLRQWMPRMLRGAQQKRAINCCRSNSALPQ
jgi:hypothetical protein